jgi:Flp pilus assembly pilin Flp
LIFPLQLGTPYPRTKQALTRLWCDEAGQDMIEYALVATVLGLFTIAGVNGLASSINNDLQTVLNAFTSATATPPLR